MLYDFKDNNGNFYHELFDMPFDKDGCHATGYEVCFADKDPSDPANWWIEYESPDGLFYAR